MLRTSMSSGPPDQDIGGEGVGGDGGVDCAGEAAKWVATDLAEAFGRAQLVRDSPGNVAVFWAAAEEVAKQHRRHPADLRCRG